MIICNTCKKNVNILSKIFSKTCKQCGNIIHNNCACISLDYNKYKNGIINFLETLCKPCAERNSEKFGVDRYCSTCGTDITISKNQVNCVACGTIGHNVCFRSFAAKAFPMQQMIYPHLHKFFDCAYLCSGCYHQIKEQANSIENKLKNEWVGGTRYEYIKGYKIIKIIGRVECKNEAFFCLAPSDVENRLTYRAIQLGANAYVKYYWEKQTEHFEKEYIKGYSKNGNPYYGTHHDFIKWFDGSAEAVVVEKINKKERS
jgi:hypothetical protein